MFQNYFGDKKYIHVYKYLTKLQILYHPIRNCLILWEPDEWFESILNILTVNIILNFPKPSNSQSLFNRLFGTLLSYFFIQFCIIIGFKETAKIPNIFARSPTINSSYFAVLCKKCDVHLSGYSLFCHYHRFKNFFFRCDFLFSFWEPLIYLFHTPWL